MHNLRYETAQAELSTLFADSTVWAQASFELL